MELRVLSRCKVKKIFQTGKKEMEKINLSAPKNLDKE